MRKFLTRLWFCVVMDDHDWRHAGIYTKRQKGRADERAVLAALGRVGAFEPHAIDFYICDRKRCHAISWPLTWRGDKPGGKR